MERTADSHSAGPCATTACREGSSPSVGTSPSDWQAKSSRPQVAARQKRSEGRLHAARRGSTHCQPAHRRLISNLWPRGFESLLRHQLQRQAQPPSSGRSTGAVNGKTTYGTMGSTHLLANACAAQPGTTQEFGRTAREGYSCRLEIPWAALMLHAVAFGTAVGAAPERLAYSRDALGEEKRNA